MARTERLERLVVVNEQGKFINAQWVAIYKFSPDQQEKMVEAYVELETGERLHWTMDNINFYDRRNSQKYVRYMSMPNVESVNFRKQASESLSKAPNVEPQVEVKQIKLNEIP